MVCILIFPPSNLFLLYQSQKIEIKKYKPWPLTTDSVRRFRKVKFTEEENIYPTATGGEEERIGLADISYLQGVLFCGWQYITLS